MDDLDRSILSLLSADARMSVATLARRLKVARSTIQARLERMETGGIIAGYTLKLGEEAKQGRLRASVLLTIEPRAQAAIQANGPPATLPEAAEMLGVARSTAEADWTYAKAWLKREMEKP